MHMENMKKIGLFLTGWCRMLLCVGLAALPSASLGARGELLADQRLNLNLSVSSASLREEVSAFTEQTGVVFSYETSLGKRTLSDEHVVIQDAPLEEMLNTLFYDTGISWKIKDHVVALTAIPSSKKNASTGSAPSPSANRKPVVTGRVINEEGEPLVGVNVLVKGTTQGTSTDIDGSYSIDVADDDVLQFTYLGYGSAEWRVGTQTRIDVVLKEDKQMLDEVVVVGYGTVKRRDLVGAVDQVGSKVFSERSNPLQSWGSRCPSRVRAAPCAPAWRRTWCGRCKAPFPTSTSRCATANPRVQRRSTSAVPVRSVRVAGHWCSSTAWKATWKRSTLRTSPASRCSKMPRRLRSTAHAAHSEGFG